MGHIDLRDLDDDDLDGVFEVMRAAPVAARSAVLGGEARDRPEFDERMRQRRSAPGVTLSVVTDEGAFAGVAASFLVGGEREIGSWILPGQDSEDVATSALRLLVSREGERPLYARIEARDEASLALLTKLGFTEAPRDAEAPPDEIVLALPPTLE